jgi:Mg2+ and Co2+ transporter CorA
MSELAIQDLKQHQGQLDEDGCFVAVSRQALNETLDYVDSLRQELEEIKFALQVEEHDNEYSCNKIDKLEAENTRLRDALKSASTYISQNNTHWNAPYHNETTRKIIEALKENKE